MKFFLSTVAIFAALSDLASADPPVDCFEAELSVASIELSVNSVNTVEPTCLEGSSTQVYVFEMDSDIPFAVSVAHVTKADGKLSAQVSVELCTDSNCIGINKSVLAIETNEPLRIFLFHFLSTICSCMVLLTAGKRHATTSSTSRTTKSLPPSCMDMRTLSQYPRSGEEVSMCIFFTTLPVKMMTVASKANSKSVLTVLVTVMQAREQRPSPPRPPKPQKEPVRAPIQVISSWLG